MSAHDLGPLKPTQEGVGAGGCYNRTTPRTARGTPETRPTVGEGGREVADREIARYASVVESQFCLFVFFFTVKDEHIPWLEEKKNFLYSRINIFFLLLLLL